MNQHLHIWRIKKKTSTQKHACLPRQMHSVLARRPSQVKNCQRHLYQQTPTPPKKVQLYIVVKHRNRYRVVKYRNIYRVFKTTQKTPPCSDHGCTFSLPLQVRAVYSLNGKPVTLSQSKDKKDVVSVHSVDLLSLHCKQLFVL